ncbi:hypothetical protein [Caballeronia pedi]|uniref:hypothetical protein n=1 Tax=Caballeronia pedi TaxID=1777141 RepID=UPI00135A0EE2|nr:hypothetical protein [Caballeronia pedi]
MRFRPKRRWVIAGFGAALACHSEPLLEKNRSPTPVRQKFSRAKDLLHQPFNVLYHARRAYRLKIPTRAVVASVTTPEKPERNEKQSVFESGASKPLHAEKC